MPAYTNLSSTDAQFAADIINEMDPNNGCTESAMLGIGTALGQGIGQAAIDRISLLIAYIKTHPGSP